MKQKAKKIEFSKILVAIDGSEISMRAAEYAINLSETKPARKTRGNCGTSGYYEIIELEEKRKEAQQRLDKVKTLAKEQNYNIRNFKSVIIEDILSRVGYAIVNYTESQSIDLIEIGTRGRTGLRKMLLGSVGM